MTEIRTFTFYFLHFYNTYITRKNFPMKQKQRENTLNLKTKPGDV